MRGCSSSAPVLLLLAVIATGCTREPEILPLRRQDPLVNPQARMDLHLRRNVLPALRRTSTLRICIDLVVQPDLAALSRRIDGEAMTREERKQRTWEALAELDATRAPLVAWLRQQGATNIRGFRSVNRLAFDGTKQLSLALVERPDVLHVWGHLPLEDAPLQGHNSPGIRLVLEHPRWALDAMGVRAAWSRGWLGEGSVVAVLDSGVPIDAPQLKGRRIAAGTMQGEAAAGGHGGAVLAAAVGSEELGVAPRARWTAADPVPRGWLDPELLAATVDWLLETARPDVVIAPWDAALRGEGDEIANPIGSLRTAGMAVAFAAGNGGPEPGSNRAPANLVGLAPDGAPAFSVGAVDEVLELYDRSSRGQNVRDGSCFPRVVAPGASVLVLDTAAGGTVVRSGTSYSCGFAGGALAVVLGASPAMTGPEAEALLVRTAKDLGAPGPDSLFGAGLIDLGAALNSLDH